MIQTVAVITNFFAAALLFTLEPFFARLVLPRMGGSPAVWNTAMVFFQLALLVAYGYAHARTPRWAHLGVLAAGALVLPLAIPAQWTPPTTDSPIASLLLLLTLRVGLPFFALAATSPLLQRWFSAANDADPYPLYAASNAGSLLGLLAYPLLIEPRLTLAQQGEAWSIGYAVFAVAMAGSALLLRSRGESTRVHVPRQSWRTCVEWAMWGLLPSGLMLSVTTHISNDIAAVPMLWVLPLGLYLLSFIIVFSPRLGRNVLRLQRALPLALVALAFLFGMHASEPTGVIVIIHLAVFFLVALICHGRLVATRPPADALTSFYLWLSIGSAAGGLFVALLAPALFANAWEYPLLLAATGVGVYAREQQRADWLWALGPALLVWALRAVIGSANDGAAHALVAGVPALVCYFLSQRGFRFGVGYAGLLIAVFSLIDDPVLTVQRSFFGIHRVVAAEGRHVLFNGTTVHGMQNVTGPNRLQPLTYYFPNGPAGQIFAAHLGEGPVAVVGLGAGSLACYGAAGQSFVFYEIDPVVDALAHEYFTFLKDCPPRSDVVLGDARVSLAHAPDHGSALIVLDAYGSDTIPVHLLTREALAMYLAKLRPGGVLAFHLSSRHFDLLPLLGSLARDAHLTALCESDEASDADRELGKVDSEWLVMASDPAVLSALDARWQPPQTRALTVWTDDYSSPLQLLK